MVYVNFPMSILSVRDCKGIFVLMCLEVLVLHTGTSLVKAQGTSYFRFFPKLQRFVSVNVCFSPYTYL